MLGSSAPATRPTSGSFMRMDPKNSTPFQPKESVKPASPVAEPASEEPASPRRHDKKKHKKRSKKSHQDADILPNHAPGATPLYADDVETKSADISGQEAPIDISEAKPLPMIASSGQKRAAEDGAGALLLQAQTDQSPKILPLHEASTAIPMSESSGTLPRANRLFSALTLLAQNLNCVVCSRNWFEMRSFINLTSSMLLYARISRPLFA